MYDAAMERITRWAPELKDRFERAAAQIKVKHKLAASLEERAAGSARKRTIEEVVEEAAPEAERRWQRRRRTIDQLREFVQNNLLELKARSGDGLRKKLRTRNPDGTWNKEEKCWYTWMQNICRTAREEAEMEELNAVVNYSAAY